MTLTQTEIPVPAQPEPVRFVGSKGGSGIAQWLISLMPAHSVYVEAFLGRGVVLRKKLPARDNIGIEIDGATLSRFDEEFLWGPGGLQASGVAVRTFNHDALALLPALDLPADALVYCDPPYPASVRAAGARAYYKHDQLADEWHERFLTMLQELPCMVIVSGYECELYHRKLTKWRTAYKWTVNRAGAKVKEFVWMNFAEPALLHDPRFVGGNYTDRQRVQRKIARWTENFKAMPADERWAIYEALSSVVDASQPEFIHD